MIHGPVVPTPSALGKLRPLPADAVRLVTGGLLGDWQARNTAAASFIPSAFAPSAFAPSAFAPSAFAPSAFAPTGASATSADLAAFAASADLAASAASADGTHELAGHPGIEAALTGLFRVTGHRPYLELACRFLENRGHGALGDTEFGPGHHQDHVPLRSATEVTGHVVRQLSLLAGAVDVAVETHDHELLAAAERLYDSALASRTYITGGQGSRHRDQAYGDPYELPPDRAYAETCAAAASFQLAWRLLLATADVRYADEMERVLLNGIAAGVGVDGTSFFTTNPLQARTGHTRREPHPGACCPPAVAALMTSLHTRIATGDNSGIQLHLYGSGALRSAGRAIDVSTRYPWDEQVTVTVTASSAEPWALALRAPAWCADLRLTVNGTPAPARRLVEKGYLRLHRTWHPGDQITLTLAMPARRVAAHPRVDATRGAAALVRGPLVYCLEQADLPVSGKLAGAGVDDLELDPSAPLAVAYHTSGIAPVTLQAPVRFRPPAAEAPLYRTLPTEVPLHRNLPTEAPLHRNLPPTAPAPAAVTGVATAIPYFLWANRTPGPMRVWLPLAPRRP
ncbi:beta-L-arabinofuranosidase domain-containing protein [Actinoplanes sp. NPDC023936]|uniref:glycoside hydrolase family 127 protein n=1 Tax=Actinoplanes sp. NPDC023936 TaxID=3154910 RepID=UPI003408F5E6